MPSDTAWSHTSVHEICLPGWSLCVGCRADCECGGGCGLVTVFVMYTPMLSLAVCRVAVGANGRQLLRPRPGCRSSVDLGLGMYDNHTLDDFDIIY